MALKINACHRQYAERQAQWERCRDAAEGSDAVKAAGTAYLPQLSGQDSQEYAAYKLRADWYGATDRTLAGLTGAVFRRPMQIEFPPEEAAQALLADLGLSNLSADQIVFTLLWELLAVGRHALYVDYPMTIAEEDRPYVVSVRAEALINWGVRQEKGREVLDWVVIEEEYETVEHGGRYQPQSKPQWRLLELTRDSDEMPINPWPPAPYHYEVSVWRKNEHPDPGREEFIEVERYLPQRRGQLLDFIPLVFFGPRDTTLRVDKPPLIDLVDLNFSHYRTSADLEHGRHFTGLPTPWVAGFPSETQLRIGSNIAWVSDDSSAKAGILEFTGQGLGALEKAIEHKEQQMAVLGARLLEEQKRAAEAAATVELRQTGETATMIRMIQSIEEGFSRILRWVAWWGEIVDKKDDRNITLVLNRDLMATRATPQEIAAIVQAVQGGVMSFETAYMNLERLEMTRENVSAEMEQEAIQAKEEQALVERPGASPSPADQVRIQKTVEAITRQGAP